jgi:hypothetical protein
MKTYSRCTVQGHAVEFKRNPGSGYISAGVNGTLVGCYATAARAISEAMETIRMIEGGLAAPKIPARTRRAVEALAAAEEIVEPQKPAVIEFALADETIRICGGLEDYAGLEHPEMQRACAAYRRVALAALEDDSRAGRLVAEGPRGQRLLHSVWAGTRWSYSCGAIGTMALLTEDEKAAVGAAHDAGLEAALTVIREVA